MQIDNKEVFKMEEEFTQDETSKEGLKEEIKEDDHTVFIGNKPFKALS